MPPAPVGTPGTPVFSAASVVTPTTLTPDTGSGYAIGDVILCWTVSRMLPPTLTPPPGWTEILHVSGPATFHHAVFAKVAASTSEAAPTITWSNLTTGTSGDPVGAMCQAFTGLSTDLGSLLDVSSGAVVAVNSTTTSSGGTAITTTEDDDLVIKLSIRSQQVANTWTTLSFTNITGGAGAGAAMNTGSGTDFAAQWAYKVQATAGLVGSESFAISGGSIQSGSSMGVTFALKPNTAPTNTTPPVVTGTRVVGETLTTTNGTWTNSPTSFPLYDWQRDGVSIGAANANTYVAQTADIGHLITCAVTAANTSGSSSPAPSNSFGPIVAEIVGTDVQFWTAAGFGLGGAPGIQIPNPAAVWDNVTHAETVAGDVEYRGTFIKNIHEVRSVPVLLWIDGQTTSPTTDLAIGIAVEAAGQDLAAIPNESTPPVGVTFSTPASEAGALVMGLLGPGQARGYWQRRTVTAGTADLPTDTCTVAYSAIPE